MKMLDKMLPVESKRRWRAIDDARFFLGISGVITESESEKIKKRLIIKCAKEGIILK